MSNNRWWRSWSNIVDWSIEKWELGLDFVEWSPQKASQGPKLSIYRSFSDDRCPALVVATHRENRMRLNRGWGNQRLRLRPKNLRLNKAAQKEKNPASDELTGKDVLVQIKTTTKNFWHLRPPYFPTTVLARDTSTFPPSSPPHSRCEYWICRTRTYKSPSTRDKIYG